MEISQEDLDAKLAEAKEVGRKEGASAKASELQAELDRVKKESEDRVKKIETDAQRKVSEQSDELGTLRKTVEDYETVKKERDDVRGQLEKIEEDKRKAEEKAQKAAEEEAQKPRKRLESMSDEEAQAIDKYIKSPDFPKDWKESLENEETAEETLAAILEGMREAAPDDNKDDTSAGPASKWLQGRKRTAVADPATIREAVRDQLKKSAGTTILPTMPRTTPTPGPNGGQDDQGPRYSGNIRQQLGAPAN